MSGYGIPLESLVRLLDHLVGDELRSAATDGTVRTAIERAESDTTLDVEDIATMWRIASGECYEPVKSSPVHGIDTVCVASTAQSDYNGDAGKRRVRGEGIDGDASGNELVQCALALGGLAHSAHWVTRAGRSAAHCPGLRG